MLNMSLSRTWLPTVLAFSLPLVGCSQKPLEPVPVSGKIQDASGKPVAEVVLTFYPQEETNKGTLPSQVTDKSGNFSLTCLKGKYKVTFVPVPKEHGNRGAPKEPGTGMKAPQGVPWMEATPYRDPLKTPWEVVVPDNGKQDVLLIVK